MDVLKAIHAGEAPREVRISAAKGLLPLEPAGMVAVLHRFSTDEDQEIREAAAASIAAMPERILETTLHDEAWSPELLHFYGRACADRPGPLEAVILNPSSPDQVILELAATVPVTLMELIVINQVRILREPGILEALLANPAVNAHIRGRVNELKFDFFQKKETPRPKDPTVEPVAGEAPPPLPPQEVVTDLAEAVLPPLAPGEAADEGTRQRVTLHQKLVRLDITGRIRLAKIGSREERMMLVKSPNKLICTAAVRSPKITDSEVESIVQLRNVHEDVLRLVSARKEWTRRYSVVLSLVKNPRTPVGLARKFLNRLTPKDLIIVGRSRDIPEVLRRTSKQLLAKKFSKG